MLKACMPHRVREIEGERESELERKGVSGERRSMRERERSRDREFSYGQYYSEKAMVVPYKLYRVKSNTIILSKLNLSQILLPLRFPSAVTYYTTKLIPYPIPRSFLLKRNIKILHSRAGRNANFGWTKKCVEIGKLTGNLSQAWERDSHKCLHV